MRVTQQGSAAAQVDRAMRGVTPVLSARRRPLHRRLVESEKPTASPQRSPETRTSVYQGCADPCYCKINLRFSSNSALSISPLANRSFKISTAREAVSYPSGSSSRRALRRPQQHIMKSSIRFREIRASSLSIRQRGRVRRAMLQPGRLQSEVRPCSRCRPKPACTIEQGGPVAQLNGVVEAAVNVSAALDRPLPRRIAATRYDSNASW